jgi:RNA polymerase sigma-70 factor (ECF subfamily)
MAFCLPGLAADMSKTARLLTQQIPRLRRYARALTGDADRADDLVQDSLERAWGRIHLWRDGTDMRAWLFTIMHNVYVNNVRSYAREPAHLAVGEAELLAGETSSESEMVINELQLAIESLPETQREVLLLIGLEQLSYEETAAILDIPVGTVMSRLSRARERLRMALHETRSPRRHLRSVK